MQCDADLPESLRFGRVEVSCEGWSRPGDPYVLKGDYDWFDWFNGGLIIAHRFLWARVSSRPSAKYLTRRKSKATFQMVPTCVTSINIIARLIPCIADTILSSIFATMWISLLLFFLYKVLRSCLSSRESTPRAPTTGSSFPSSRGWFPGGDPDSHAPPPPYSKTAPGPNAGAWQPGFWTGAALGGMGTYLMNRNNDRQRPPPRDAPPRARWDWEQTAASPRPSPRAGFGNMDRGEGSSNLGSMRSSTGYGGSRVR